MSYSTKNKMLIGLLLLLLLANIVTISMFWLGKPRHSPQPQGQPADYIIKELGFDDKQKETFTELAKQHQQQVEVLRQQVKTAKDDFFVLLQKPALADSEKINASKKISIVTEQLDLITFDHFKKVRAICNTDQQKKFDTIIRDVLRMVSGAGMRPPGRLQGPQAPGEREGPSPRGEEQDPPPPPRQ